MGADILKGISLLRSAIINKRAKICFFGTDPQLFGPLNYLLNELHTTASCTENFAGNKSVDLELSGNEKTTRIDNYSHRRQLSDGRGRRLKFYPALYCTVRRSSYGAADLMTFYVRAYS